MKRKIWLLALLAAVLLSVTPALADDGFYVIAGGGGVGTKITSLPYEIKTAGFYYLGGNLTRPSGNGITVSADDVTLDLMGFSLNSNSSYNGICMDGRKNVEIRNGTLRGWGSGIIEKSSSAANHRVINIRTEGNYNGIILYGSSHLVKGCAVSDTINGFRAIYAEASCTVSGNQVNNCTNKGIESYGGTISNNVLNNCASGGIYGYGTISGNTVYNSSTGTGIGIDCTYSGNVIGNVVFTKSSAQTGINLSTLTSNPIMMDQNTVSGAGTHYSGGSSATVWAGKSTYYPYGNNAGAP